VHIYEVLRTVLPTLNEFVIVGACARRVADERHLTKSLAVTLDLIGSGSILKRLVNNSAHKAARLVFVLRYNSDESLMERTHQLFELSNVLRSTLLAVG
jgi:hypothetical protein